MARILTYTLFVAGVLAIGLALGVMFTPGSWYASLAKPPFNPPGWLFGPVWTILYVLIGISGARSFEHKGGTWLWLAQMALNFAWTPVFFGMQRPGAALVIILALLVTIIAFIIARWNADRPSTLLFIPYAAWVAFAAVLNASIVLLN